MELPLASGPRVQSISGKSHKVLSFSRYVVLFVFLFCFLRVFFNLLVDGEHLLVNTGICQSSEALALSVCVNTLSAVNVSRILLRLISMAVLNFTHPPILSTLLLILSASRFHAPDFSCLHCWFPRLFCLRFIYMEWPSPSSPTETFSGLSQVYLI